MLTSTNERISTLEIYLAGTRTAFQKAEKEKNKIIEEKNILEMNFLN